MRYCSVICSLPKSNQHLCCDQEGIVQISSWDFPGGTIPSSSVFWPHTNGVVEFCAETMKKRAINASNSDC
jgi:hypothetical protein